MVSPPIDQFCKQNPHMIVSEAPLASEVHAVPSVRSKERDRVASCICFYFYYFIIVYMVYYFIIVYMVNVEHR